MAEKPAPEPDDGTYSDEEVAKRMDATVRAMIGMKPKPRPKSHRTSDEAINRERKGQP
jgi:hypothetical protein